MEEFFINTREAGGGSAENCDLGPSEDWASREKLGPRLARRNETYKQKVKLTPTPGGRKGHGDPRGAGGSPAWKLCLPLANKNKKISDKLYYKTSKQHAPGGQVIQNLIDDKRTSDLWMQREYHHCLTPSGFNGSTPTNNLMTQTPTPTPNTINIKNFVP